MDQFEALLGTYTCFQELGQLNITDKHACARGYPQSCRQVAKLADVICNMQLQLVLKLGSLALYICILVWIFFLSSTAVRLLLLLLWINFFDILLLHGVISFLVAFYGFKFLIYLMLLLKPLVFLKLMLVQFLQHLLFHRQFQRGHHDGVLTLPGLPWLRGRHAQSRARYLFHR